MIWVCVGYAAFCLLVATMQRSLLYFPSHHSSASRLRPWIVNGETIGFRHEVPAPRNVWLMMHGNAGQASDRDYVLEHMARGDALYVLEYPGYGARSGSPSKSSFDAAAKQAYAELRKQYPDTPIGIIGESIGSGPASILAAEQQRPNKIVLITPFDSLYRVAAKKFFFLPVGVLLLDRWDNVKALDAYDGPLEIFGAESDMVIPVQHAKRLSESCRNATFHLIPGGHNDWPFCARVRVSN